MNYSNDASISVALDQQAEMVRRVQAVSQPQPAGRSQGLAGRPALALAMTFVAVATGLLVFVIR